MLSRGFVRILAAFAAIAVSSFAWSQTVYNWSGIPNDSFSYNWEDAASWNPAGGPPTALDTARFTTDGIGPKSLDARFIAINAAEAALSATFGPGYYFGVFGTANNSTWGVYSPFSPGSLTLGGSGSTGLTTTGPHATYFQGPTLAGASATNTLAINVNGGSQLFLQSDTKVTGNQGNTNINNGHLILDNTFGGNATGNATDRFTTSGTIKLNGSGIFELFGGYDGGTYNVGSLNTADNSTGGVNTIRVAPNSTTANTVLNFANTGTFSLRQGTRNVTVFEAGNFAELGSTNGPRIKFTGTPFTGAGGLLTNSSGGQTPGWAIVKDSLGTNFATYSETAGVGIVSIASTNQSLATITTVTSATELQALTAVGASGAGSNGQFNTPNADSETISATAQISAATLRISPGSTNGVLAMGSQNLRVAGLMLDGSTDYSITASTTPGNLFAGTHYIYVNNPETTLSFGMILTSSGNQFVFAGPGYLDLTNTVSQNAAGTARITIAGGVLRANDTQIGLTSSGSGQLNLVGGVLEIRDGSNGTGASADFRRNLGTGTGTVNWGGNTTAEQGSGGFSAFGANASVNIGGNATPSTLQWNSTNFVGDGYALKFGSTKSNAVLTFLNPINLENGTGYQLREFNVVQGVGGDFANITGVISGAAGTANLVKTGNGRLDLSAANTYTGETLINQGSLVLGASGSIANSKRIWVGSGGTFDVTANPSFAISSGQTLTGLGTVTGTLPINGKVQGGTGGYIGSLNLGGNTTINSGGAIVTTLGSNFNNGLYLGSNFLDLKTGSKLELHGIGGSGGFDNTANGTWVIASLDNTSGDSLRLNGVAVADGAEFGRYVQGTGASGPVQIDVSNFGLTLNANNTFILSRSGNDLVLSFVPVPEPATMLAVGAGVLGLGAFLRRKK